jgi:hypothetical protein
MKSKYIPPATIESIADQIRADFLPESGLMDVYEINIYRIAQQLGCKVEIVDFDPSNVSAVVVKSTDSDNQYTIQVSRSDSEILSKVVFQPLSIPSDFPS